MHGQGAAVHRSMEATRAAAQEVAARDNPVALRHQSHPQTPTADAGLHSAECWVQNRAIPVAAETPRARLSEHQNLAVAQQSAPAAQAVPEHLREFARWGRCGRSRQATVQVGWARCFRPSCRAESTRPRQRLHRICASVRIAASPRSRGNPPTFRARRSSAQRLPKDSLCTEIAGASFWFGRS